MTGIWWGKESSLLVGASQAAGSNDARVPPELMSDTRRAVTAELLGRAAAFAPEWTSRAPADAGIALARLFGEQMEPVLRRANRLPEKVFIEFLDLAGIEPLPATPAQAFVEFEVADTAPQPILIGTGFQLGASPAEGGERVVFETQQAIYAAPAKVAEMHAKQGSRFWALDFASGVPFLPFGQEARPGCAFFIGLTGKVTPGPVLSLGIRVAAPPGAPPPARAGGIAPLPIPPPPTLRWDLLDGGGYEPVNVISDGTAGLFRSGVIEIGIPRQWRVGRPEGMDDGPPLRWLRVKIAYGEYSESPSLLFVKPNMAQVQATRSIRDEVLEPVAGSGGRRWRLSQIPVLPGSLELSVDEGVTDLTSAAPAQQASAQAQSETAAARWREVEDLSAAGPDERVYSLDLPTGEVTFGDGARGMAAPIGFRHIKADLYRVGGGRSGAVDAEAISTLLSSATFLKGVKNPLPTTGGVDQEGQAQVAKRGPQEIRARGRAVTPADYALLAQRAPGADIQRAHAVAGFHPLFPGRPIPGVVGVFVVPPDRGEGPPTPDEAALSTVAQFLSRQAAPAGVEVVAAAPVYQTIRVEVGLVMNGDADMTDTVARVTSALSRYLDPLRGGDAGEGWPFGGILRYPVLLRLVTNVSGVHAVPRLNLVVDGVRIPSCQDHPTAAHVLLWPATHEITVIDTVESS